MVVLGGGAVSYERGNPVWFIRVNVQLLRLLLDQEVPLRRHVMHLHEKDVTNKPWY